MVDVTVSISFQAESIDAANAEIASWILPEGASVFSTATEQLAQGIVQDGEITAPPPPPEV
jgi:hypothetical protein